MSGAGPISYLAAGTGGGASQRARFARPALIDGTPGIVVAPPGRLFAAIRPTIKDDLIAEIVVIGDAARLRELNVDVWED